MIISVRVLAVTLILISLFFAPARAAKKTPADISPLARIAYEIMFAKEVNAASVNQFILECEAFGPGYHGYLGKRDKALGVIIISDFNIPLSTLQKTLLDPRKEKIFKSTIYEYSEDTDSAALADFALKPEGYFAYTCKQKVKSRFKTKFAFSARSELVKSGHWLLCRESLSDKPKLIGGHGGYIDALNYFTILVAHGDNRTLRISGCWNDSGGEIPVVGKVRARYNDIYAGMNKANKDIAGYFGAAPGLDATSD